LFRLVAAFAMLLVASACAPEPPIQTAASAPSASTPSSPAPGTAAPQPPRRDPATMLYASPALQAYVERVGNRLVTRARLAGGPFRFGVLDVADVNAWVLADGRVFVTRGLLALLDDEAELAATIAHELAHLSRRHHVATAQARRTAIDNAVAAAEASGSISVGRSVLRDGLLAARRYSREQELEADRVALPTLAQAGYRTDAMVTLIDKLWRHARLEAMLVDLPPELADRRRSDSTHPAFSERLAALRELGGTADGEAGRQAYLAAIDGMSVDDARNEGFVRGRRFLHPTLRLAFEVPEGYRILNDSSAVLAIRREHGLVVFSCYAERPSGPLTDWLRRRLRPTPVGLESTRIGDAEAAIADRQGGAERVRFVAVRHGEGTCAFNLRARGADRDAEIGRLTDAARGFRALGDSEVAGLRPFRLKIIPIAGVDPERVASRLPYPDLRMERLTALNGVDSALQLPRLRTIKTVVP